MKVHPWERDCWGVAFRMMSSYFFVKDTWHEKKCETQNFYPGEPPHVLMFNTRQAARDWCSNMKKKSILKFRPVRVRETVTVIS